MIAERFESALWETASLLLMDDREAVLVDPAVSAEEVARIAARAGELGVRVTHVLATHADWDHVCGIAAFPEAAATMSEETAARLRARAREATVAELAAAGGADIAGEPLDQPKFEPIFTVMAELDAAIWLHPARTPAMTDYASEPKSRYEMWWCLGWPYDTSVAMIRMVFWGLFDRHPKLKIITHHLGGMIPYYDGRIGPGLQVLGARTSDEDYSQVLSSLKRPHMDYLHDFYADTAMFGGGVHATRCGLEFFGADHVVFATDTPLGPIAPTIKTVEGLGLSAEDRRKVFCGNAEKLLKRKFS